MPDVLNMQQKYEPDATRARYEGDVNGYHAVLLRRGRIYVLEVSGPTPAGLDQDLHGAHLAWVSKGFHAKDDDEAVQSIPCILQDELVPWLELNSGWWAGLLGFVTKSVNDLHATRGA